MEQGHIRRKRGAGLWAALCLAVPAGLYAATMPPTITWWFGGSDSGELVSAAAEPGVPHPPGYPLFVALGYAATRIPVGDAAGRVNAMNVALMTLALAVITIAGLGLAGSGERGASVLGAAVAAFTLGTSVLVWSQAVIGEVYALHAALVAGCLLVWSRPVPPALRGAMHGLALTNHTTSVILLVAALAALAWERRWPSVAAACSFAAGLVLPLALYLLLPLLAIGNPDANWGDPRTPGRFWDHVTARQYRGLFRPHELNRVVVDLLRLARTLAGDLAPWILPAAAVGGWSVWKRAPRYGRFLGLSALGVLLFTASYASADRSPYLLPVYLIGGVCAGQGLVVLWEQWAGQRRALAWGGATVVVLLSAVWAGRGYRQVNLRGDDSALLFARATLEALPANATYLTARDDVTFALWYLQRTQGFRRDVRVIDIRNPLLQGVK